MQKINSVPLKFAFFFFLFLGGSKFYSTYIKKPDLTIIGYIQMADGLGRQTVELINSFKDDLSINFIATRKNTFFDVPHAVKKITKGRNKRLGKVILFKDALWHPGHNTYKKLKHKKNKSEIRIAYSMFESSAIPSEWATILNTYFDAVAVPDPFLIDIYQKSGVQLPIFVLPLGLNLQEFLNQPLKKEANTPFVFANLSTCVDRKNQIALLHAFAKAFGNDERARLLINCRICSDDSLNRMRKEIAKLNLHNVQLTTLSLDKKNYLRLFQTIDCYVNLAKGEGFSIKPREAMALGIPVIAADSTGQRTLCNSALVERIPITAFEPASYPWGATYGYFSLCDTDKAAEAMKEIYQNYPEHLKHSQKMRHWVEQYQYKNLKPYYRTLVKPKKVILGDENKITPDCLVTNSKKLYRKYKKL